MRFRRWKRTKAAVFASIGKTISLASLTTLVLSSFTSSLFAQLDTVFLKEIEIRSSRMPQFLEKTAKVIQSADETALQLLPADNLHEVLGQVGVADIRSRGADGIQSDIAFRAGNFEQTLLLINGVAINDIQTGHHNLNLPVAMQDVRRLEILQGPGNRFYGINSYSGAVNIITKRYAEPSLSAYYGSYNRFGVAGVASLKRKRFTGLLSASYRQSDGYLRNDSINNTDYKTTNLFFSGSLNMGIAPLMIDAGFVRKSFGANDFYTPAFPWQYEALNTGFLLLSSSFGKQIRFEPALFYRRNQDRFELFREDVYARTNGFFVHGNDTAGFGGGYYYKGHNHHVSHVAGAKLNMRYSGEYAKTTFGFELREERLFSNVLGEEMTERRRVPGNPDAYFTRSAQRLRGNLFGEYYVKKNRIAFSGGGALTLSNVWQPLLTGGVDVSYDLWPQYMLYMAVNRTARLPSYTDLYYSGPLNIGNPDLKPETALNGELGIKRHTRKVLMYLNGFYRYGQNTIDWAKEKESDKWQSRNITQLNTFGTEVGTQMHFSEKEGLRYLFVSYSFAWMAEPENPFISKYVLDYLKHALRIASAYTYRHLDFSATLRAEDRAGSYIDYDRAGFPETAYAPYLLLDLKAVYHLSEVSFYVTVNNVLNTQYHEIASVKMPGIQFQAGVTWRASKR